MRTLTPRRAAGALGVIAPLCGASAAHAQSARVDAVVTPEYVATQNGDNGWYRVPIRIEYTCSPAGLVVACPAPRDVVAPGEAGPFGGTATFTGPNASVTGYALLPNGEKVAGVDTVAPTITVTRPEAGRTYDAGAAVSAAYGTAGGLSPESAAGPVPSGAAFDTGSPADPRTWGTKTFTVNAADAAGNAATPVAVTYTVTDLPKPPTMTAPADRAAIGQTAVVQWTMPDDDGVGTATARVEVRGGVQREYAGVTSPFTIPSLPLGAVAIRVVTVDAEGHEAPSSFRGYTVVATPRPPVTPAGATPSDTSPSGTSPSGTSSGRPPVAAAPAPTLPRLLRPTSAPPTYRARLLRPKAGARVAARPTLRWGRVRGATLYNVQVYRLAKNGRFIKVISAFPRANRFRVPPRKLAKGTRYAWRVWPYMGAARRYKARPIGVTWFRRVR